MTLPNDSRSVYPEIDKNAENAKTLRPILRAPPSYVLLGAAPASPQQDVKTNPEVRDEEQHPKRCPACGIGHMVRVAIIPVACEPKLLLRQDSS